MKYLKLNVVLILALSYLVISCSTVPVTGRKQFNIIPNSTMLSMSFQQYNEFINTNKLSAYRKSHREKYN